MPSVRLSERETFWIDDAAGFLRAVHSKGMSRSRVEGNTLDCLGLPQASTIKSWREEALDDMHERLHEHMSSLVSWEVSNSHRYMGLSGMTTVIPSCDFRILTGSLHGEASPCVIYYVARGLASISSDDNGESCSGTWYRRPRAVSHGVPHRRCSAPCETSQRCHHLGTHV